MRAFVIPIVAATLGLGLCATTAQAQEISRASKRVEMLGVAPAGCVANSATASKQQGATYQDNGPSGGVVVIPVLVDENTAVARESSIELALPVVCNTAHRITVRRTNGGLVRVGSTGARNASGGFAESQAYNVALQWQQQTVQLGGATTTGALSYDQPAKGDIIVDIAVPRGTQPLVAGTYRDDVVVEIRPTN